MIGFFLLLFVILTLPYSPTWAKEAGQELRRTPVVIAVEKVSPSVVNISTEETIAARKNPFSGFGSSLFEDFFKDFNNFFPQEDLKRQSLGSGVIIDPKGYILTNEHVVTRGAKITVALSDKREFEAKLIGGDSRFDLAVLKIESKAALPYAEMGRSDDLMIGEPVLAIGNPFGLSHTVSTGVISALNRNIRSRNKEGLTDLIQIDAPINPGNSGGPLVNIYGKIIGINTAIYQNAQGIGFAIPIDRARRIVDDLITYGEVPEIWLGVVVQELTQNLTQYFKLKNKEGVLVSKIEKNSPAEHAGLKEGDVIITINGQKVIDRRDFIGRTSILTPEEKLKLTIFRNGKELNVELVAQKVPEGSANDIAWNWLGISIGDINPNLSRKYQLMSNEGVVILQVKKGSAAARTGIEEGDLLRQINRFSVNNAGDFRKAIIKAKNLESVILLVQRGPYGYYVTLTP